MNFQPSMQYTGEGYTDGYTNGGSGGGVANGGTYAYAGYNGFQKSNPYIANNTYSYSSRNDEYFVLLL